ncbi:ABC transporter permease [Corynebacterium sp.]|uniref:ABC transporter permease n=1 Tax=Corynebacterium sp. TaxID=1720 RepID=UPI002A9171CF|nr:FtsX-like permease family protein [Corynebacterium sp.]MDY5785348.1 FtsX-like permease family protein [Corynebacterium sp.]
MASTLTRVSMRNIAAHKLRLFLTVLAVVLGTAFIAGSLMFTSMLERTFDSAVSSEFEGIDAVVQVGESGQPLPTGLVEELQGNPYVLNANQSGSTTVVAATSDNTAIQTGQGGASVEVAYPEGESVGASSAIVEGRAPQAVGEALLNRNAAERYGIALDAQLIVVDASARHTLDVVGFYDDDLAQPSSLGFKVSPETYNEYYTDGATVPQIVVHAEEGISPDQLVDELRAAYPDYQVDTGQALADEVSKQIREGLSFVSYFLIAFGLVGLLVGMFLIANTFSMIVAQRTKEFALLRALGASRRQISRSVSVEAFIVGLIGSTLGVVAGAVLVSIIKAVMGAYDMSLPDGGLGLSAQAVAVPIVVGVIVTMLSAWAPARRAGRVQPVEAMRASESASPQPLRGRTIAGLLLLAAGAVAAGSGMAWSEGSTADRAWLVGAAALSVIAGVFLAGPALSLPIVPPLGRVIGAPFGAVGKLASTNSSRNPRRTSATAFALLLGIALVTVIGMLGATMKQSVSDIAESQVTSDFVLASPQTGMFPVPATVPDKVAELDGVGEVIAYSEAPVAVNGEFAYTFGTYRANPVFSADPSDLFVVNMEEGESTIDADTVIAPRSLADSNGWAVGDTVAISAPGVSADTAEATIGGIFEDTNLIRGVVIDDDAALKVIPNSAWIYQMVGVRGDGSVTEEELRNTLVEAVQEDIVVQVKSASDMSGEVGGMIDQMLFILYALLSLAVVIAVLGIINTLTLSVIERRQEIGMLRAVGTQRGQVRTMIILESVQMAVFGAVAGILMGLGLGWAFLTVLADQGLERIIIPWPLIVTMLIGSIVIGVLAALWPAQRATTTPPLDAIAE